MSGHDRKGRWRVGPQPEGHQRHGRRDLDLNDAELADDLVEMTVFSLMGGADIRVPEGLNVELLGVRLHGRQRLKLGDERPTRAARRCACA